MSSLNSIANPMIADAAGSLRAGQERRKTRLSDEMIGEILNNTVGGKLGSLAKIDPEKATGLAQALEIPVGQTSRLQSMIGDIQVSAGLLKQGIPPQNVAKLLGEKYAMLSQLGIKPSKYMEYVQRLSQGDQTAVEEIMAMNDAFVQAGIVKGVEDGVKASATTQNFSDGTSLQTRNDGSQVLIAPDGREVTDPAERMKVLQAARQADIDDALEKSGARESGKETIKLSSDAFKRLEPINKSIANIEEGIRLLDEGASTGPIMSKLPSIRSASIQLDNLQNRLGLDVIGETTFGALSEGELALALNTALPKNLEPPQLRNWLVEKRDAQKKLANYLSDVAVFLGTPGNTIPMWVETQREIQKSQPQPQAPSSGRFQIEVVD